MTSFGITLSKYRRRFLYKYYKASLLWYIFKKDHDYDYAYFLELIYRKLTNIALVIRKEDITMSDKKIAHQIWEARKILKKVLYYDYEADQERNLNCLMMKKYGYTIDFSMNIENHTADFKYFPVYYINDCLIEAANKPLNFDEAKEYWQSCSRQYAMNAFENKKQDLRDFFDCVVEHIWEWAD